MGPLSIAKAPLRPCASIYQSDFSFMPKLFASPYSPEPADPHAFSQEPPPRDPGPVGILLVNLGTPDEPTASSIRRYLGEFLSDPRVIEIPKWLWQIILRVLDRKSTRLNSSH